TLLRGLIAFLTTSSSVGVRPGQKGLTAFALKHWATPPCDTFLNRRLGRDQRCRGLFDGPAYGIPSLASEWPRRSTLPSQERAAFSILQPCVRSTLVATSASGELSGESGEESDALLLRMSFESVEAEDLREWIRRAGLRGYVQFDKHTHTYRWRKTKERKMGAGTATRAVETGKKMGTGTGTRTAPRRLEERRRSARNHTTVVDAIRHFHSARVIISADKGWRLCARDSSVRKARCLYTRIALRG
ncbi:unnamed protein product, partial [Ascophyllum nodosum]